MVLLLVMMLCLWASGLQNGRLVKMRADYRVDSEAPMENAPPLIAFTTVAFGGFGTLVADLLWLRVSTLQDEGRYFELVQLADWITKLEPRCGEIWEFHAWNMAYNVSVMMPDPEDRWRWVRNGIELLRDEGIRYNAGDPRVYWQLGWLFLNKIGGNVDQSHVFYKARLAEEMTALFGGGYPDYDQLAGKPELLGRITGEYKLKLPVMRKIDQDYGPVDWRVPESHALYWAVCGMEHSGADPTLLCEKLMFQSLRALFVHGRRVAGPDGVSVEAADLAIYEKVSRAFESALVRHPADQVLKTSHAAFLVEAIRVMNENGRKTAARELFDSLSARYPSSYTAMGFDALIRKSSK